MVPGRSWAWCWELPECLTWLRRDYESNRTEQIYEQSLEERSKPVFRVRLYNCRSVSETGA